MQDVPPAGAQPAAWTYEFDSLADHCVDHLEFSGELPPVLADALTRAREGGSSTRLRAEVEALLDDPEDTDVCDAPALLAELEGHRECCTCAEWAWEGDRDYLDTLLGELPDREWILNARGELQRGTDPYSWNSLRDLLGRGGWYHLKIRWDPEKGLRVSTDTAELELHPATAEELLVMEFLEHLGSRDEIAQTFAFPREHLREILRILEVRVDADEYLTYEEVQAFATLGAGTPTLSEDALEVACTLAHGWPGTLTDLYEAATTCLQTS